MCKKYLLIFILFNFHFCDESFKIKKNIKKRKNEYAVDLDSIEKKYDEDPRIILEKFMLKYFKSKNELINRRIFKKIIIEDYLERNLNVLEELDLKNRKGIHLNHRDEQDIEYKNDWEDFIFSFKQVKYSFKEVFNIIHNHKFRKFYIDKHKDDIRKKIKENHQKILDKLDEKPPGFGEL